MKSMPVVNKLTAAELEDFEMFWRAYPKRVNKPGAMNAWKRLRPSREEAAVIIERLKSFPFSAEPKYIPHPASWINGRRWEDEHGHGSSHGRGRIVTREQWTREAGEVAL
jgi:hypothetical protein